MSTLYLQQCVNYLQYINANNGKVLLVKFLNSMDSKKII